jgi:hypothetical protein
MQHGLEAVAIDSGSGVGAAEVIDHDVHAGGLKRRQDFRQVLAFDVGMDVPAEVGETAKERAVLECRNVGQ